MENIKIRLQFIEYILRDIKNYSKQEEIIYKKVIKEKIALILSSSFITEFEKREIYYNTFAISLYKIAMYEYYLNISTKAEKTAIYNKIENSLINDHNKLCELITEIKDYDNDKDILIKINNLYINI
jgi:hypothetical protein